MSTTSATVDYINFDNSTTTGVTTLPATTTIPGSWTTTSGTNTITLNPAGGGVIRQEEPDVQEVIDKIIYMTSKRKLFKIIGKCRDVNADIDEILKGLLDTEEMNTIFIYLRNVKNKNLRIAEAANDRLVECL